MARLKAPQTKKIVLCDINILRSVGSMSLEEKEHTMLMKRFMRILLIKMSRAGTVIHISPNSPMTP